jgi:excisionase family DNA binding protein
MQPPVQSTERQHHTMTVTEAEATLRAQAGPFPAFGLLGLLTYDDAAKILKTTTRHVERLVSRRQLKAVELGQGDKLPRIRPADWLAFIDSMEPIARADDPAAAEAATA